MAGKNDVILYDYNIYRIPYDKCEEFIEYLSGRSFEEIPLKQSLLELSPDITFTLMYCDKKNKDGSHWVKSLSMCTDWPLNQEARVYGAALVCRGVDFCYVVSYGNAHFYIGRYCDYNFGVSVAERVIDLGSIKSQQNVSHGNTLSKTHFDYLRNTPISYDGGEIPTYIKGKSIDKETWGESVNCGTSAQFKWPQAPLEISDKLIAIDNALKVESAIKLPRLTPLDDILDSEKIDSLYLKLSQSIAEYDPNNSTDYFNVPSFYLLGTRIIQTDFSKFKITCNHKKAEYSGELSIEALKDFIENANIDIYEHIRKINIAVDYSVTQWTPLRPVTEYLEYITDDNFCLRNGKWCSFNTAYVDQVLSDISRLKFNNHIADALVFDKELLREYAKKTDIYVDWKQQPYESYYNKLLEELFAATGQHPNTVLFEEQHSFRFEPCDLFTDEKLYFVKIGEPNDFAMAIDQAAMSMRKIKSSNNTIVLRDDKKVAPTTFVMILVFEKRSSIVDQWSDIKSLNFLIHLSELRRQASLSSIELQIEFCYTSACKSVDLPKLISSGIIS